MRHHVPTLVQVSTETCKVDEPQYDCDPESGLLYAAGDAIPVIERILEDRGVVPAQVDQLETVISRANTDPADPDLVRAGNTPRIKKLETDVIRRSDPDVVRFGTARRIRDLETDLQKVAPDPDVVRATRSRTVSVRETDA
jgi:hypothetical protein